MILCFFWLFFLAKWLYDPGIPLGTKSSPVCWFFVKYYAVYLKEKMWSSEYRIKCRNTSAHSFFREPRCKIRYRIVIQNDFCIGRAEGSTSEYLTWINDSQISPLLKLLIICNSCMLDLNISLLFFLGALRVCIINKVFCAMEPLHSLAFNHQTANLWLGE